MGNSTIDLLQKSKEPEQLTPLKLRHRARGFALIAVDEQCQGFKRYAVGESWEHPFLSLTPHYKTTQLGALGWMVLNFNFLFL